MMQMNVERCLSEEVRQGARFWRACGLSIGVRHDICKHTMADGCILTEGEVGRGARLKLLGQAGLAEVVAAGRGQRLRQHALAQAAHKLAQRALVLARLRSARAHHWSRVMTCL